MPKMMCKKNIVAVLIVLFTAGALAQAASGITACPPERCCCATAPQAMMGHGDREETAMPIQPNSCAPQKPAPCCQLESDLQPFDVAVRAGSVFDHYRALTAYEAADTTLQDPLVQTYITAYSDDGRLNIPQVPIYLQTLSILC